MSSDICVVLTRTEFQALHQVGPDCLALYVVLRSMMDLQTGAVGLRTAISRAGLCREMETATQRGAGVQVVRPSEKMIDGYITRLVNRGLLQRKGGKDALVFLLPMSYRASIRSFQWGDIEGAHLSTDQGGVNPSAGAAFGVVGGASIEHKKTSMRGHIRVSGCTPPQSSSTPGSGVAPGDAGAGGVNRDRAAPSQAGPLGRPGKPGNDPYRDRPAGSHVGPWGADSDASGRDRPPASHPAQERRLEAEPDADGTLPDGQRPTSARSLAEKESFADGMATAAAPDALLRAVLAARGIREDLLGVVDDWAHNGVTPDEVATAIDKARAARIAADSIQPIPLRYVAKVVASNRAAARRAVERLEGRAPRMALGGVGDIEALAAQLGIAGARPGETREQFRDRVLAALQQSRGVSDGPA